MNQKEINQCIRASKKDTPIIFTTPMVQAILEGRKTQTRRIVKCYPGSETQAIHQTAKWHLENKTCPYGQEGDLLWVREACSVFVQGDGSIQREKTKYKADRKWDDNKLIKWRPSIHMPKAAARIWLKITGIRVERLQSISNDDAAAEGVKFERYQPIFAFGALWQSIHGEKSWHANPWVWVIEFTPITLTGLHCLGGVEDGGDKKSLINLKNNKHE